MPGDFSSQMRLQGYQRALREMGVSDNTEYHAKGDYTVASGARACKRLFSLPQPPDAVFACSDLMAAGVIRRMYEMHLTPGKDAAIFGFDDVALAKVLTPTLSTVSQSRLQLGRRAMELLLKRIEHPEKKQENILIGHKLIFRESTRQIIEQSKQQRKD